MYVRVLNFYGILHLKGFILLWNALMILISFIIWLKKLTVLPPLGVCSLTESIICYTVFKFLGIHPMPFLIIAKFHNHISSSNFTCSPGLLVKGLHPFNALLPSITTSLPLSASPLLCSHVQGLHPSPFILHKLLLHPSFVG